MAVQRTGWEHHDFHKSIRGFSISQLLAKYVELDKELNLQAGIFLNVLNANPNMSGDDKEALTFECTLLEERKQIVADKIVKIML
ncbi:Transposase [Bacillus phage Bastille]|uniref:Transposase n=1 Tax=Bacillus phage Bastille TaxID=57477 RepID=J9PKL2_9CAUD|nr:Transposase [Bacillus phage Bastille]AEQ34339.1 Transposase [Bacillus phage Bastille]